MADETSEFNSESTRNILPNTSDNLKNKTRLSWQRYSGATRDRAECG